MAMDLYFDNNPLVTVIMATYNRAAYLDRSISSFLQQSFTDTELLIVDDGSVDESDAIIRKYMHQHTNIRYIRHSNRRLSLSKNAGIKAAAGKYIAFLDSDDEYLPDYLEKRVTFMEANPTIDIIEGGAIIKGDPYVKDKNDLSKKIHLSECHIGPTFFGKTSLFLQLGGFDKAIFYSEDSHFMERAHKVANVFIFNHPGYIYYRDTPGGICNSI
jgi:glycosyltransferase involved in cell wall biosynthesis